jgi:hypothetical protein
MARPLPAGRSQAGPPISAEPIVRFGTIRHAFCESLPLALA